MQEIANAAAYWTVSEVLARYAQGVDERRSDVLANCFTIDAQMTVERHTGETGPPLCGRDQILAYMADYQRALTDQRRHVTTNILVDSVDETNIHATSYLLLTSAQDGACLLLSTGRYHDHLVLDEGRWRIKKRHLKLDSA